MFDSIKSKIKIFLLNNSPSLYSVIFKAFQRLKSTLGQDVPIEIFEVAQFTRKGFYKFHLDDLEFDIHLNPANGWVDSAIFLHGSLEPQFLRLIRSSLRKEDVFFDIGANIGQHGLYASNFCKSVYCFEPIARLYDQLQFSINKNEFRNVHAFNLGMGNENKMLPIYSDTANMGGSSILFKKGKVKDQLIKIVRLDDFLLSNPTAINMIKIDVEGFELEVLKGAERALKQNRPKLLIEFSLPLYNQISPSHGNEIYLFLSKIYSKIFNVGLDLEINLQVHTYEDIKNLNHHTNLWCDN
jgi:FkbM family methyltransferase